MTALLWVPVSLLAGLSQLWRNGLQADLTQRIGTLGATQVRFLYGLPFAMLFLLAACLALDEAPVLAGTVQLGWVVLGALAQIGGTALMLVAMRLRSFAIGYVYIKTEPVLIALAGTLLLGDHLSALSWLGVALATSGVVLASAAGRPARALLGEARPAAVGIAAGALYALSAVCFRGAILESPGGSFLINALAMLCATLVVQTALLLGYMLIADRQALTGSLGVWRQSLGTGLLGAFSSACWFIAFALTPAANVRTLGLVEMPGAALLNRRLSGKRLTLSEWLAMALVLGGVGLVLEQAAA